MTMLAYGLLAGGAVMSSRLCHLSRGAGFVLAGAGALLLAVPAIAADETLMASDNSEVTCTVSLKGLTRISLKDDRFASISKMTTGIESEDFTVVNEPTRGDVYLSVPDGYSRSDVSFFGTTAKGYVYKFACRVGGDAAHQVFVHNRDILGQQPVELARRASPQDAAITLVQAMYAGSSLDGFEVRQPWRDPVHVGDLKVQMIAEYRGLDLNGRVLRIENKGRFPTALDEKRIAPANAVAVSLGSPNLKPGEATTAYVVLATGAAK